MPILSTNERAASWIAYFIPCRASQRCHRTSALFVGKVSQLWQFGTWEDKGVGRSWLARASVVMMSATMLVLSACGAGNASVPKTTPGVTPIGNAGTLIPGVLKWGEDSTGGMPYIAPKDLKQARCGRGLGFQVDIASRNWEAMNVTQQPTQCTLIRLATGSLSILV